MIGMWFAETLNEYPRRLLSVAPNAGSSSTVGAYRVLFRLRRRAVALFAMSTPPGRIANLCCQGLSSPRRLTVRKLLHSVGELVDVCLFRQITKLFGCDVRFYIEVLGDIP